MLQSKKNYCTWRDSKFILFNKVDCYAVWQVSHTKNMGIMKEIGFGIASGIIVGLAVAGILLFYQKGMNYVSRRLLRLSEQKTKWISIVLSWALSLFLVYWYYDYYRPSQP